MIKTRNHDKKNLLKTKQNTLGSFNKIKSLDEKKKKKMLDGNV